MRANPGHVITDPLKFIDDQIGFLYWLFED